VGDYASGKSLRIFSLLVNMRILQTTHGAKITALFNRLYTSSARVACSLRICFPCIRGVDKASWGTLLQKTYPIDHISRYSARLTPKGISSQVPANRKRHNLTFPGPFLCLYPGFPLTPRCQFLPRWIPSHYSNLPRL